MRDNFILKRYLIVKNVASLFLRGNKKPHRHLWFRRLFVKFCALILKDYWAVLSVVEIFLMREVEIDSNSFNKVSNDLFLSKIGFSFLSQTYQPHREFSKPDF